MTSTAPVGVSRAQASSPKRPRLLAATPALLVLLLAGLVLRLAIAYVFFPASGFESDIASFVSWALTLGQVGPTGFYEATSFADYPPGYLYLLWPIGVIAADAPAAAAELVKLPAILIDVVVAYVIYRLVLGWSWPGPRAERLALIAAALYLFNPVSLYDSALWGQADAAGALVLLLGAAALIRGNSEGAMAMAAMAAVVKPQFGVVLVPLVSAVLIKRHLVRPGSGPRRPVWAPPIAAAWLSRVQGWPRLVTSLVAGIIAFHIVALPFGLGILEYLRLMGQTAGGYDYLSVNAFNLWSLFGAGGTPPLAQSLLWSPDGVGFLGPIPAVVIGAILLTAGFLWGVVRAAVRDDRWTILVALAFLAIAFFLLPTRVHERYIFPAIAILPVLAVVQARWGLALVLLSLGAIVNLHAILTVPLWGSPNVETLPFGELFRTQPFIVGSVVLQTAVGVFAAWQLRPGATTSPDGFDQVARTPNTLTAGHSEGFDFDGPPGAAIVPSDVEWVRGPSALDWIIHRLSAIPLRKDRSEELRFERGGRIDRLDILLIILLIIGTATLRGFRLDEPYGMYFDEVYHARTATEFLQHWEYDQRHDIYEFTHPHLAKYVMAWGIRAFGGNEVSGRSALGVPVHGAALERRWAPSGAEGARHGDRLYVGTGDELVIYDLSTRDEIERVEIAAEALALDEVGHRLFIADPRGAIFTLDTTAFDPGVSIEQRSGALGALTAGPGVPVEQLVVTDAAVVTLAADGVLTAFDRDTGDRLGFARIAGATEAAGLPWTERVVVETVALGDVTAAAVLLGSALQLDPRDVEARLDAGGEFVVLAAWLDDEEREGIVAAIDDGDVAGVNISGAPMLAVAHEAGISFIDAQTLDVVEDFLTPDPAVGLALSERGLSDPTLFATAGASLEIIRLRDDGPSLSPSLPMPGTVRQIAWNEASKLVHVLGDAPDGGPTVYVVEPNGNTVFIDVPLQGEPDFLLPDTQPERPTVDRGQLLALAADGELESIGIAQNAFGWRFPGVLLGALGGALIYLLARVLFARRSVAVIAAVLIAAEGMLFANSRIAMNDVYVTTLILAGVFLFSPLYVAARRRPWTVVALLLGAGVALGLAFAAKWVAIYAIGGLALLVLLRSGLGRLVALAGMVGLTVVLGALAIRPSPVEDPNLNWAFLLMMVALTGVLAAAIVRRPLPITRGEVWLAGVGPIVLGSALVAVGLARQERGLTSLVEVVAGIGPSLDGGRLLLAGALSIVVGIGALVLAWAVTRFGHGPFGGPAPAGDGTANGWLRPAWLGGIPWLLTLAALTLLPIAVYIIGYAPWVSLGNQWGLPLLGSLPFLPASDDSGQTLLQLTTSMYEYHDDLRAEHAASSPWWAWPFDLKPVWFYQERFAGDTTGLIYDTGNLVIFWLGVPAMAFSAFMAWRRRSVALTLVVLMWAAVLLPWARIDRATFQYHVYASLPFLVLALAYFLAELWHGPGPRTWFLARASAALAILAAPLMWLFREPLCLLAGTSEAHPDGSACSGITRTAQLSDAAVVSLAVLAVGAGLAAWLGWHVSRARSDGVMTRGHQQRALFALIGVGISTIVAVALVNIVLDATPSLGIDVTPEVLALMGLVVLAIPGWMTLRARDSRRFVVGVLAAAVLWLLIWYPNISGLPLPSDLAHAYQGLLPTWNWDFQFAVNIDPATNSGTVDASTLIVGIVTVLFVVGIVVIAAIWGRDRAAIEAPGEPPAAV